MRPEPSILIVDDDPIVGFAMADYLQHRGFTVARAQSVAEARAALAARQHDLLLADLRLEGTDSVDGLDLAGAALQAGRIRHAIVVTAYSGDATITRAAVLGVAAVVNKPVPLAELAALITTIVTNQTDPED